MEFRHRLQTDKKKSYLIEVWNNDGIIKLEDTEEIYYLSDLVSSLYHEDNEYPFN